MAERITSPQNPYLQHVKKLRAVRKYRYANRAFLADGSKLVEEAIRWGLTPEAILTREGVPFPVPEGVRHIIISDRLMKDVSRMDTPQGVMAVCPMPEQRAPELVPGCLILDGIQDPGNLGTILRTADAFDLPVVLSEGCADPYGEKTVRATMGAVFRTQPCQADRRTILDSLRARQIPLCVTALSPRAQDIRALDLKRHRQRGAGRVRGLLTGGRPGGHHPHEPPVRIAQRRRCRHDRSVAAFRQRLIHDRQEGPV